MEPGRGRGAKAASARASLEARRGLYCSMIGCGGPVVTLSQFCQRHWYRDHWYGHPAARGLPRPPMAASIATLRRLQHLRCHPRVAAAMAKLVELLALAKRLDLSGGDRFAGGQHRALAWLAEIDTTRRRDRPSRIMSDIVALYSLEWQCPGMFAEKVPGDRIVLRMGLAQLLFRRSGWREVIPSRPMGRAQNQDGAAG